MVIIYEIIYFLLYHSILVSIVGTLEIPDDLFNDAANKIVPEQLQREIIINETDVKIWFDQIEFGPSNTATAVSEVTAPGIKYYVGLYFIIDTSLNSSRVINFLHPHVRILNRYLSKVKTLSYIAGIAHVPPLPSDWLYVSVTDFLAGIQPKLDDILKSRFFDNMIMVFVFKNKRDSLYTTQTDICSVPIVYWDYDLKPNRNGKDLNTVLFHDIVYLLNGCLGSCTAACYALETKPVENLSQEQIQCITNSIQTNEVSCTKKPPEDVFVPVCGNGIIEYTESCDCLNPLECGSKCGTNCNLRQKARGGTNRFFIIAVSAAIIAAVVSISSLIFFLYLKNRNNLESRNSGIAIPIGGSKTEINIPHQAKLKDWALTCTKVETTIRDPSKSKLELGIKEIVSSDRSKSKINAVSKESFSVKNIISVDRLQSVTDAMSFERLTPKNIASKDRPQSKTNVTSQERLKPRSIASKKLKKSKTNASSKERLISKRTSSTKASKSKLPVDLDKSIEPEKTTSSKSVGKASLINLKTVASKSLLKSKTAKSKTKNKGLKHVSFK